MKLRRITIALSSLALVTVLAGITWWFQHRPVPAKYTGPTESITTGLIGEYASLIVIAQDQGYFKDAGLDVTIKEYASGPSALADLLAGKLDTAMAADFAGVSQSFKTNDLRILGTLSKSEAFDIIGRRDHGLSAISDLRGKKVGITRQTVGEFYFGQFLIFNRLAMRDVTLVNLTQQAMVDALQNGTIDAAVLFEPNAYKAKTLLGPEAVRWSVQSGQSIYSLLYTTAGHTTTRPEALKRYMQAVVRAERFVKDHSTQARDIIARRFHYDTGYINYIWPKFTFAVTLDQELLLNMDDEAHWAIENQITSQTKPPNYLRMLYLPALEAAKPEGITIIR